jgi:hypothetical protein
MWPECTLTPVSGSDPDNNGRAIGFEPNDPVRPTQVRYQAGLTHCLHTLTGNFQPP